MVRANEILTTAAGHLQDRAATYDRPEGERSMGATVAAFRAVAGITLTEEQGWLFMVLLKAVRTQQGGHRADNYEDGAAYFALAGETAAVERMRPTKPARAEELQADDALPEAPPLPSFAERADTWLDVKAACEADLAAKDGWIEWAGGLCPADVGARLDIRLKDGDEYRRVAARDVIWTHTCGLANVVAYRIAKDQA